MRAIRMILPAAGFHRFLVMVACCAAALPGYARSQSALVVGDFSKYSDSAQLPEGWQPLTFKNISAHTRYELIRDGDAVVIRASSRASASGLIRNIRIDPAKYPFIRWRWKISNTLKHSDVTRKAGDDYPARIYITFEYDPDKAGFFEKIKYTSLRLLYGQTPPSAAISYIWASRAPEGTVVANAYTEKVMMIAVQSGDEQLDTWVSEQRNVYEDFKTAFGTEPPAITGVAIMTDTDNTGESAVAWYGDIGFYPTARSPEK